MTEGHIFQYNFIFGYNQWIYHGETTNDTGSSSMLGPSAGIPDLDEIFDVLGHIISDSVEGDVIGGQSSNVQYDDLFIKLRSQLYPDASSFSSLNFLVKLMHIKVMKKWTNKSFDELLKLLKQAFPKIDLVDSHYQAKKMMTKLGFGYRSIHVCKNEYTLFWNENSSKETCPVCSKSWWKIQSGKSGKKVLHKVL